MIVLRGLHPYNTLTQLCMHVCFIWLEDSSRSIRDLYIYGDQLAMDYSLVTCVHSFA